MLRATRAWSRRGRHSACFSRFVFTYNNTQSIPFSDMLTLVFLKIIFFTIFVGNILKWGKKGHNLCPLFVAGVLRSRPQCNILLSSSSTNYDGILLDCEQSLFSQLSPSLVGRFFLCSLRSISLLAWPSWGTARSLKYFAHAKKNLSWGKPWETLIAKGNLS